jgi:arylsulfatase A-like enzyme
MRQAFAGFVAAWLALGLSAFQAFARAADSRPNILVVLIDDLRYDALGCTGQPFVKTPNIDRIGREGAIFRNAFVTTPLCSPSRASYLTGQFVHSHEVLDNSDHNALSHRLITYPKLLHDAGYETAFMGKWHMGNDSTPRPGFDRWVSFKGQGQHNDPALNIDGQEVQAKGYMTDILTDHAVAFVRKEHKAPFLLYLAYKAVHGPFIPAERHQGLYTDDPIRHAPSVSDSLEGKPILTRRIDPPPAKAAAKAKNQAKAKEKAKAKGKGQGGGGGDELIRNQLRMLTGIDEGVGRLLEALGASGALEQTMIVFASDNGYFWGEHGLGDKRAAYEESIRIPLLMRKPGLIAAGTTIEQAVLNIDIAPTMLELAGVAIPATMQGRSMVSLLKGNTQGWPNTFFSEYFQEPQYSRIPTWQAVRDGRWKYIHYTTVDGMDELYDLQLDPYELKNLNADPTAQETLGKLKVAVDYLAKNKSAR